MQASRVLNFTKTHGQKLIVLDETWWKDPKTVTDLEVKSANQRPVLHKLTTHRLYNTDQSEASISLTDHSQIV